VPYLADLDAVCERIAALATDNLSGITAAFDPPPAQIDTAELPALYVLAGEASNDWETHGDYEGLESRRFNVHVPIIARGQGNLIVAQERARPLLPQVKELYFARPTLGGLTGIWQSNVIGDTGVVILPTYGEKFIGFEVQLNVSVIIQRAYAAGE
jgi:hypothetical protein